MADAKQATETVCEHCGEEIVQVLVGWVHYDSGNHACALYAAPRTQPIQELRIPDDLKRLCIACGEPADHSHKGGYSMCGACCAIWGLSLDSEHGHDVHEWIGKLIERIAQLEGAIRWANGEVDEFRERKPGEGAYWWRKELMRRARLEGR